MEATDKMGTARRAPCYVRSYMDRASCIREWSRPVAPAGEPDERGYRPSTAAMHAAMLAEHGGVWAAYCRIVGEDYATADGFGDAFRGIYDSEKDYAESLADDCGLLDEMPEHLRCYFDFDAFARDLFLDGYTYDREDAGMCCAPFPDGCDADGNEVRV